MIRWSVARADWSDPEDVRRLLEAGWEPISGTDRTVAFRKKFDETAPGSPDAEHHS